MTRAYKRQPYIKCDSCGKAPEYVSAFRVMECDCEIHVPYHRNGYIMARNWNAKIVLANLDRALLLGVARMNVALLVMSR